MTKEDKVREAAQDAAKCYPRDMHSEIAESFITGATSEEKYTDGISMNQFVRCVEISVYNNNYFNGFEKDLLFGKSDDDNTTEWYLVKDLRFIYLGESYITECDILHRYNKPNT